MDGWLVCCNGWRSTPWWADKSTAYRNHTTIYYPDTHKHTYTHILRKKRSGIEEVGEEGGIKERGEWMRWRSERKGEGKLGGQIEYDTGE